ncbi:MAG TPA: DNA/RNA non-specific endonuclease [Thermoanaerobaculia bacterium]
MSERSNLAKRFLAKVQPGGGLEAAAVSGVEEAESISERAQAPAPERKLVRNTLEKLASNRELTPPEEFALEAIIIPDKRPAIDVVNGDFAVQHPLWLHYGTDPIRSTLRRVLPSIGRVEVAGIPGLPFGGTGFVVGSGLLMTNRHVAGLFSSGLGRRGLTFRPGIRAGVDFKRERGRDEKQFLHVRRVLMIHPHWDMAILQVEGLTDRNPPLVLALETPEQLRDREVAVIGYPAFDPRNPADVQNRVFNSVYNVKRLQPGLLGRRRAVRSFDHTVSAMTHDASTLGGNSGSAVIDVTNGNILALHFAGVYLDANFTVPASELARDQRVIEAGVKFRSRVVGDARVTDQWWSAVETAPAQAVTPDPAAAPGPAGTGQGVSLSAGDSVTWTIPLQITVRLGGEAAAVPAPAPAPTVVEPPTEKPVMPVHDTDYSTRKGYVSDFLEIDVPMPEPVDETLCAQLLDGSGYVLPYHHFSLVMHKGRRLTLIAASNLDASPDRKEPEPGKLYTRKALGGLGKNDMELWFTDPRIAAEDQLPDRFFSKDKGAFDRGHVVRREDVAWGASYQEVQFANGDTFHTPNCTPQVAGFNQPSGSENWGDLEKYVSSEAGSERLSIFAGPVLADDDPIFVGVDDEGPVRVQIPRQYWKVILAEEEGELRAFAFVLRQDLSDVPIEFAVGAWGEHMIAIGDLEELLGNVRFPGVVHQADQADTEIGEAVRGLAGIELVAGSARQEIERPTPNSGDDDYAEPDAVKVMPSVELEAVVAWRVAKSLLALRNQVNAKAPRRSKASDGTIGDAAHATRNSDHNPWVRDGAMGVVTAMDITHDPANGCDAGALAEAIRASRDARVKYIIWNRRIASSSVIGGVAAWTWRPYTGSNPHSKHVHISVRPEKAAFDSEASWAV